MNNNFWFILSCGFILLEIGNPGLLYFLAIAIGSIAAFAFNWLDYSENMQYLIFFTTCAISISCVYFFSKYITKSDNTKFHKSNTDLLIGKIVTIIEVQSLTIGQGKIDGEQWLVKLNQDGELKIGMKCIVVAVQGCHLQVKISTQN